MFILKNYLVKGLILTDEFLQTIKSENEIIFAKAAAYNYATYKPRTIRQTTNKLREKSFSSMAIDAALDYLKENNILNDKKYATDFIKASLARKGNSFSKIKLDLIKNGIGKFDIEDAFEEFSGSAPEIELTNAKKIIEKNMRNKKFENDFEKEAFIKTILQKGGFSYDTSRELINQIKNEEFFF